MLSQIPATPPESESFLSSHPPNLPLDLKSAPPVRLRCREPVTGLWNQRTKVSRRTGPAQALRLSYTRLVRPPVRRLLCPSPPSRHTRHPVAHSHELLR